MIDRDFNSIKSIYLGSNIALLDGSSSNISSSGGFFYYSNNPETITWSHTSDNQKWLNRASVLGDGFIYTWHMNKTGEECTFHILIHNTNEFSVRVNVTNYGVTAGSYSNDVTAWANFWSSDEKTLIIEPGSWASFFSERIQDGDVYGVIASLNITDKLNRTNAASVDIYDIAYIENKKASAATSYAMIDESYGFTQRRRGLAGYNPTNHQNNRYWISINLNVIDINVGTQVFNLGDNEASFNGNELVYIIDQNLHEEEPTCTGPLAGNYGVRHSVTIPVYNPNDYEQDIKIIVGNRNTTPVYTCVYGYNLIKGGTNWDHRLEAGEYNDIFFDTIPKFETKNYTFQVVIPAMASAPLSIGVRKG